MKTPTSNDASHLPDPSVNARFAAIASQFLEEYLRRDPVAATTAGDHRYDAAWPDLGEEGERAWVTFYERTASELAPISHDALSLANQVDASILGEQIRYGLFAVRELRDAENNPLYYTTVLGDGLDPLLVRDFAPIAERMHSLRGRLSGIRPLLEIAKQRLVNPPRVHTETALEQTRGLIALCEHGLDQHIARVPELRPALERAAKDAADALKAFAHYLEHDLMPKSRGDFRLGAQRFRQKLQFVLADDVDPDEIVRGARALLARTQDEMVETSKELWPSLFPGQPLPALGGPDAKRGLVRKVIDKLGDDHPSSASVVAEAKKLLADASKFVADHDLVRLPDEACDVIEMPEYRRGVTIAYCDASGPLEKKRETYYAISPTPKSWSKQRSTSFYREYNRSMLANLTVHEAMPGHYLQLMHAARYKSDIRAVFASGAFIEGWAVYAEWLMAKHGFGGPRVRLMRQKMILRTCANAILDHDVHAGSMDEKAALAMLEHDGFQEEGEAIGKWRRVELTSAQLTTYYYGFTAMMKERQAAEAWPEFTERGYHDALLGFGSPPMHWVPTLLEALHRQRTPARQ